MTDIWEPCSGGGYRRKLPPSRLSEFFAEETGAVYLTRDGAGWWIGTGHDEVPRDGPYTLAEARRMGDRRVEAANAGVPKAMVEDARLDPALWRFAGGDLPGFIGIADQNAAIVMEKLGQFALYAGDDRVGVFPSAASAAEALAAGHWPGA